MSHLYRKGSRWCISFYLSGKEYRRSLYLRCDSGGKMINRKLAENLQAEIDADLRSGKMPSFFDTYQRNSRTVVDYLDEFERHLDRQKKRYSPRTIEHYKWSFGVVRQVLPADMALGDLDKAWISRELHPFLYERYKAHSAHGVLKELRAAFNRAVEWGYIKENPFSGMVPKPPKGAPDFYSLEEIETIRVYCSQPEVPEWQGHWIFLALNTGLRKTECLDLSWSQINLEKEWLRMTGKGGRIHYMPLNRSALAILRRRPRSATSRRVFWEIASKSALESAWRRLKKRTGLEQGTIHKLRRTYASYLAMQEGNMNKLRDRMRHEDITTTMIYAGIARGALSEGKNLVNFELEGLPAPGVDTP